MAVALGIEGRGNIPPESDIPPPSELATSLYNFQKMTEGVAPDKYFEHTQKLLTFSRIGREAIDEAAKMLNCLQGMSGIKANEPFQEILEFLGEKRGEAKRRCKEKNCEECDSRRVDEHIYALVGFEGASYTRLMESVAAIARKFPFSEASVEVRANDDEKLVASYVSIADVEAKLKEHGEKELDPALVCCHRYIEKHFPQKDTTGTTVAEHERTGYLIFSQQMKTGKEFSEVAKKVVWINREKVGSPARMRKHAVTKNVHIFSCGVSSFKRVVRPAVVVFSPTTTVSHALKEGTSVPAWVEEMAALSSRVIAWQPDMLESDVKNLVARIRYIFAHVAPFQRGNIVVGEWLELAFYKALGFQEVKHLDDRYSYEEALATLSFAEFREKYDALVNLGKHTERMEYPARDEGKPNFRRRSQVQGENRVTF